MDRYEPDDEFVEGLEWQLRRELRRERFAMAASGSSEGGQRGRRLWRMAAVVALSLLTGFATATAAQEISDRRAREYLSLRLQTELDRADLQVEFAHRRLQEARTRVDAGTLSRGELHRMEAEVEQVERQRRRTRLALEEVSATGREPRTDLAAPRVEGRDFVLERLELEVDELETHRRLLAQHREELLVEAEPRMLAQQAPRLEAELELVDERLEMLHDRQRLRRRFVAGEIGERQVLAREEKLRAEAALRSSRASARFLQERVDRLGALIEAGEVGEGELLHAEFELAMAELDLRQAQIELEHAEELSGR